MKKSTIIIVWALITSVASVVFYEVLGRFADMNSGLRWFAYLILFTGLVIGTLQARKAQGGYITFGQGYVVGLFISLITAVIQCIHSVIYMQMNPDVIKKGMDQAMANMVNKGYTQEQIDMGMKMARMFTTPLWVAIFTFLAVAIIGAILSLVSAGITAKPKPLIEEDTNNPAQ